MLLKALQSALLKNEIKNLLNKDASHLKIAKTLKIEKTKTKNEKKSNNSFLLLLFYIGKFIFCQKTYLEKLSLYCYICITVFFTQQVVGNAVTPTPIYIFINFVGAILRSKILDNRLGILTQILITMDYFVSLYILDIQLQFREKSILIWAINLIIKSIRKEIEILAKCLF